MILIIEDDANKMAQLCDFVHSEFPNEEYHQARSYQSGLRAICELMPTFIILDISLSTFDISRGEKGFRTKRFGGREILGEMKRKRLTAKVVVVTQFDIFGHGVELITLDQLKSQLAEKYANLYLGTVYYQANATQWRDELKRILSSAMQCGGVA